MTLLSPWFLLGVLGVGLPLWLHLLQRENPVRLPFASLMFFEKRTQSTLLQRQFRYLLLLAARLALIALLVFAFSKPIWERPPTTVLSDIPSLHLIVLDTSMSMRFGDRWDRAVESARSIINGMVEGVSEGFTRTLQLVGTGYRAEVKGKILNLSLGLSHPVNFPIPEGVTVQIPGDSKGTMIVLTGSDKALMGQTAATIRGFRPPSPYGGKGVRYANERVRLKAGKAAGKGK